MTAVILLILGIAALAAVGNAHRPMKTWWATLISWPAALLTIELAPQLIVLSVVAAGVLASLGGLNSAAGQIGLVALLIADAYGVARLARSRRNLVAMDPAPNLRSEPVTSRYPRIHAALPFLMFRRPGIRRTRGVVYASLAERDLRLDIYESQEPTQTLRPAVIYVHGGGLVSGSRGDGVPMLTHLAANGWVAFSIDYRVSPKATFPDHLVDVKRAIAWVRDNAGQLGIDASFIAISGGSAGAYLAALAALTADDPTLQPGFADADTSVAALVALYGVYDLVDEPVTYWPSLMRALERWVFKATRKQAPELFRMASPMHRIRPDAPPALIIWGDCDTLVRAEQSRRFAKGLRDALRDQVYTATVAGGQHCFDLLPSLRTIAVVDEIEGFLASAYDRHRFIGGQLPPTTSQQDPAQEHLGLAVDDRPPPQSDDPT